MLYQGNQQLLQVKKSQEKQLAFLVMTFNSMLAYGMPTCSSKLKVKHIEAQQGIFIRSRYDDISTCGKLIQTI
jgi:hypothetical protein